MKSRSFGPFLRGALAVLLGFLASLSSFSMAGASSLNVLSANHEVTASSSVGGLTAPVDGRLRGPDFSIDVTGVAWPAQAGGYEASAGQRLVVIEMPLNALSSSVSPSTLSLAVTSPGHSVPLDFFPQEAQADGSSLLPPPNQLTYVVSVPNSNHEVNLVATEGSFSQSFSLWTLKRTSSAPAVLYADPSSAQPNVNIGATLSVPITNAADGVTLNSNVIVSKAKLSAFDPVGSTTTLTPNGSAYVTVQMSSGPPQLNYGDPNYGHFFSGLTPIPGSAVTLTAKGGASIAATKSNPIGQANNPNATSDDGMVDATYTFLVPLSQPTLTLSIGPATTMGVEYTGFVGGSAVPLQVGGPITMGFSLPAVTAATHQPTPPWVGQPNPPTGTASASDDHSATVSSGGGAGITIPIALGVLVLVGIGVFFARKRGLIGGGARPAATSTETVTTVATPTAVVDMPVGPVSDDQLILNVNVLGPLTIDPRSGSLSAPTAALVSYLALHADRPRSASEIQLALWPDSAAVQDVTKKTFHNYVSKARQSVGALHMPEATNRGYVLTSFRTDLDRFSELLSEAEAAEPERSGELRAEAVALFRGQPFEGDDSEFLQWVNLDGTRTQIVRSVTQSCHDHGAALLEAGDLEGAETLLRGGLRVATGEMILWQDLTGVLIQRGDVTALRHHLEDAATVLDPDEVDELRGLVPS